MQFIALWLLQYIDIMQELHSEPKDSLIKVLERSLPFSRAILKIYTCGNLVAKLMFTALDYEMK